MLRKLEVLFPALILANFHSAWAASEPRLREAVDPDTSWTESPKKNEDWPGLTSVTRKDKKQEIELRLWQVGDRYILEFLLGTVKPEQEILDPNQVAKPYVDESGNSSFFWAQVDKGKREPIDIVCNQAKKVCSGKWQNFPYKLGAKQNVTAHSTMRGLENREWIIPLESAVVEDMPKSTISTVSVLKDIHGDSPGGEVRQTVFFTKEAYKNPFADIQYAPIRIEEWRFKKRASDTGIGLHKIARTVLFEVVEGIVRFEIIVDKVATAFEVRAHERLWAPAGSVVALRTSGGSGEDSAVVRRVEFP